MAKEIFRKEVLERMSSPEQLDQLMPITSRRGWIALAGIGALLIVGVLWGVFGQIETNVPASGALMRVGGLQIIDAPVNAEVTAVAVKVGDTVTAGQELLRLNVFTKDQKTEQMTIRSRLPGRVLDLAVIAGDLVEKGNMLVSLESPSRPMQAVLYISTQDGYKVEAGKRVKLIPATSNRYASRYVFGTVKSAGRFPATRATVFRGLQNEDLVNAVTQSGPVLEVLVDLPQDDDVTAFFSGTPCRAEITIDRKPPLNFVIPIFGSN